MLLLVPAPLIYLIFFSIALHHWCVTDKEKASNFSYRKCLNTAGKRWQLNKIKFCKKQSPVEHFQRVLAESHKSASQTSTHPPLSERAPAPLSCLQVCHKTPNIPHSGWAVLLTAAPLRAARFIRDEASSPCITAFLSEQEHYHNLWPTALPRGAALLIHFHICFPLQKRHSSQVHMDVIDAFVKKVSCPFGYLQSKQRSTELLLKYKTPWLITTLEGTEIQGQHTFKQSARSQS